MTECTITFLDKKDRADLVRPPEDHRLVNAKIDEIVLLEAGTASGKVSVAIVAKLPDGRAAFIETTGAMLDAIHAALQGARQRWNSE